MSHNKEATCMWVKLLDVLQHVQTWQPSNMQQFNQLVRDILFLPALSSAAWNAVIHEKQVPLKLCKVCLKPANRSPMWDAALIASLDLLIGTQMTSIKAGLINPVDNPLPKAIGKQLDQAGLLQQLPGIITTSAQEMRDFNWAAAAADGAIEDDLYSTNLSLFDPAVYPLQHMYLASSVLFGLELLWPLEVVAHKLQPVIGASVLQFFVQALQSVSQGISALPAGAQQPPDILRLITQNTCLAAANTLVWGAEGCMCCSSDERSYMQLRRQLLQSPYCLPASCLLMLIASHSTLPPLQKDSSQSAQALLIPPAHRRSMLVTKTPLPVSQAWQFSCSHHSSMPMPHAEMLRLLGCSNNVCMWAAAMLMPPDKEHLLSCACKLRSQLTEAVLTRSIAQQEQQLPPWAQASAQLQQLQQGSPQHDQRQRKWPEVLPVVQALHVLAPTVLLHWVGHYAANSQDLSHAYCSVVEHAWLDTLWCTSLVAQQQVALQQRQQPPPGPITQGSAVSMQQLLHELLDMALNAQHAQLSVWQESSTPAQTRSAASAVSSPDYQQISLADSADGMVCVVKGVVDLLHNHTKLVNPEAVLLGTLCDQQLPPEHIRLAAESLQEHAVTLCSGVEYYVRAQAATAKPATVGGSLGQRLQNARKGRQVFEGVNPVNEFAMLELLLLAVHEGPGGKTQQHLLSMLFSMLKSCTAQGVSVRHALHGRFAAFYCAVEVLSGMQRQGETSRGKHGIVEAALPWLALCGRCCMQWARDLRQPPQATSSRSGSSSTEMISQMGQTDFVLDRLRIGCTADLFFNDPEYGVVFASTSISLVKCLGWLQAVNTNAQTRAAGVDLGPALEALERAVELTSSAPKKTDAPGAALGILKDTVAPKLDALGLALSSLPYRDVCNNPGCRDMSGESDMLLVKGRKQCSGCHYARYCCKDCSKQHWPQHRAVCKALAAAKAGGGSSTWGGT